MSKLESLRNKLAIQFGRISRHLQLPKNSKEISNSEIEIASAQYFVTQGQKNEYGENQLEWLHDRLTRLTCHEMKLYRLRFEEGMTYEEMSVNLGLAKSTIVYRLNRMYAKLRKG